MEMNLGKYKPIFGNAKEQPRKNDGKYSNKKGMPLWERRVLSVLATAMLLAAAYGYGVADHGNVVYAQNIIVATSTPQVEQEAPVLQRIGDCESGERRANGTAVAGSATQYGKDGQVIVTFNTNGTHDTGKYAINSIWGKKATDLGLDLSKEADNYAMAKYLYENKGTGDWSASASCWQR